MAREQKEGDEGRDREMTKYKKGKRIDTISEFDQCESLWYKWHGRTTNRSVLTSLQYRKLWLDIINGYVYTAERIEEIEK